MSSYTKLIAPVQSRYSTLDNITGFKCGGSKCSCQFKDARTMFDKTEINILGHCNNPKQASVNSFDKNSYMYLGV